MNLAYKKFEASQETIEKIIREKKEKLFSLKPQLQAILEVSQRGHFDLNRNVDVS
jgi:hypothetical protein